MLDAYLPDTSGCPMVHGSSPWTPRLLSLYSNPPNCFEMPRSPACRHCAKKKVGCRSPLEGLVACQRCVSKNLQCEWPQPHEIQAGAGTHRRSCDRCRLKRAKCELQEKLFGECLACSLEGVACSLQDNPRAAGGLVSISTAALTVALEPRREGDEAELREQHVPRYSEPVAKDSSNAEHTASQGGNAATSTAGQNADRAWWNVVITPSPR
ncbi:hypothetical protein OH77DRAFT_541259 [Trametes cingulata]|nr:hypothetical protein OH77DRAFT_541259 [Trametes cingulata]